MDTERGGLPEPEEAEEAEEAEEPDEAVTAVDDVSFDTQGDHQAPQVSDEQSTPRDMMSLSQEAHATGEDSGAVVSELVGSIFAKYSDS